MRPEVPKDDDYPNPPFHWPITYMQLTAYWLVDSPTFYDQKPSLEFQEIVDRIRGDDSSDY